MLASNGHACADILKFDVEGTEHSMLADTRWERLCAGMVLFEMHGHPDFLPPHYSGRFTNGDLLAYVHRLEAAGFRHYATELVGPPTGYHGAEQLNGLVEMAFVNVSWLAARVGMPAPLRVFDPAVGHRHHGRQLRQHGGGKGTIRSGSRSGSPSPHKPIHADKALQAGKAAGESLGGEKERQRGGCSGTVRLGCRRKQHGGRSGTVRLSRRNEQRADLLLPLLPNCDSHSHASFVVVGVASVPPRYRYLQGVVRRLAGQTSIPDVVVVAVSRHYSRFDEVTPLNASAFRGLAVPVSVVEMAIDMGPVAKLLGPLQHVQRLPREQRERALVITVDDDVHYPPWLVQTLATWAAAYPSAAIAFSGGNYQGPFDSEHPFHLSSADPNTAQPLTYLGVHLATPRKDPRYTNIAPCTARRANYLYGYTGVAYRPGHFCGGTLQARVDWIAGECWRRGQLQCPTSPDDQYISGVLSECGHAILVVPPPDNHDTEARHSRAWTQVAREGSAVRSSKRAKNWTAIFEQTGELLMRFPAWAWKAYDGEVWQPRAGCAVTRDIFHNCTFLIQDHKTAIECV